MEKKKRERVRFSHSLAGYGRKGGGKKGKRISPLSSLRGRGRRGASVAAIFK